MAKNTPKKAKQVLSKIHADRAKKNVAPLSDKVSDDERLVMQLVAVTGYPKSLVKAKLKSAQLDFAKLSKMRPEEIRAALDHPKKDEEESNVSLLPAESDETP